MSYDIFFVRRDPGQSFEDALADVEESFDSGDPGPLTEGDLEQWEAVLPVAREILGPGVEVGGQDDETRELTDPVTGIGLTLVSGELQVHVPDTRAAGPVDVGPDSAGAGSTGADSADVDSADVDSAAEIELMRLVYDLARAVEDATGLEGYDPQLGEPVSALSAGSPARRRWDDEPADEDDDGPPGAGRPVPAAPLALDPEPFDPQPSDPQPAGVRPRRWWELWKP